MSFVRKNAWTLGLIALFFVLLGVTRLIQPEFGVSGLESLAPELVPWPELLCHLPSPPLRWRWLSSWAVSTCPLPP